MAVGPFGRRATLPTGDTLAGYVPTPPKLRVLRADGQRIDLTARDVGKVLAATRQTWQERAFAYRDMIGELRYAQRLRSRAVARCRFYIAEQRTWPQDPIPLESPEGEKPEHGLDPQLAADAIANFRRIPFDHQPDGFVSRIDENLGLVGEAWCHIDADDQFHVRSVSEVSSGVDGRISISGLPGGTASALKPLDPRTEDLLRLWVPHPQWGQLADAPMRAMLEVAEDVVLAGREQRSAARSRLNNGVVLMSQAMSFPRIRDQGENGEPDDDSVMSDTFMSDFATAMLAPVEDDGDPAAVVPVVLRGAPEDLEVFRHVTFHRPDSEQVIARQSAALVRLLRGLDVQPEQVEGLGAVNHWSSWLIDARAIRDQIQPSAETIAASLMQAFMRPALESLGHRDLSRITIAVDTSPLSENPNRGQDARDAHGAFVISDEALRRELGFDDEDKPDDAEILRRMAAAGRFGVTETAEMFGLRAERDRMTVRGEVVEQQALPAGEERPVAQPGQVAPERPIPAPPTEAPVVVAAAAPDPAEDWRVDTVASRRLADLDAALVDRVATAADAALQRVLEKAGARVRSQAQKDRTLTASLAGVDAHLVPSALGRERVESFVPITDLITDSYDRLRAQVAGWLDVHAVQTADAAVAILGVDGRRADEVADQVRSRLATHRDTAWPLLAAELDAAAEELLFDPDPLADDEGEASTALIDVGAVIEALAAAGGEQSALTAAGKSGYGGGRRRRNRRPIKPTPGTAPAAGPATGPVVRGVLAEQGAVNLGFEWSYRPEVLRSTFDPHKQLDGARFTSWRDDQLLTDATTAWVGTHFRPRDHRGCRCTGSVVWGVAADPESQLAQALRDAHGRPDAILTAGGTGNSDLARRARAAVESMRATHMSTPRRRR